MYSFTNQKQLREAFFQAFPELPRRRYRYSPNRSDKAAPLVFPIDTRCAFVDWIDQLERNGDISAALANRATL
jgi:5'-deoxynucleotidase YfbR-like HD superfamily hydrolase